MQTTDREEEIAAGESWLLVLIIGLLSIASAAAIVGA